MANLLGHVAHGGGLESPSPHRRHRLVGQRRQGGDRVVGDAYACVTLHLWRARDLQAVEQLGARLVNDEAQAAAAFVAEDALDLEDLFDESVPPVDIDGPAVSGCPTAYEQRSNASKIAARLFMSPSIRSSLNVVFRTLVTYSSGSRLWRALT